MLEMISYQDLVLVIGILAVIAYFGCLVWIVLDNKKFYEELDKQRYGWYNKEEEKQGGQNDENHP